MTEEPVNAAPQVEGAKEIADALCDALYTAPMLAVGLALMSEPAFVCTMQMVKYILTKRARRECALRLAK